MWLELLITVGVGHPLLLRWSPTYQQFVEILAIAIKLVIRMVLVACRKKIENKQRGNVTKFERYLSVPVTMDGTDYTLYVPYTGDDAQYYTKSVDEVLTQCDHPPGVPFLVTANMLGIPEIMKAKAGDWRSFTGDDYAV